MFYKNSLPFIKADYIDKGLVKFVFRNYPLQDFHDNAMISAIAGEIAHYHGKFWEMHDTMFKHANALEKEDLINYAKEIGIEDPDMFGTWLDHGAFLMEIMDDIASGNDLGVAGIPTFFINGEKVGGYRQYPEFKEIIEAHIPEPATLLLLGFGGLVCCVIGE